MPQHTSEIKADAIYLPCCQPPAVFTSSLSLHHHTKTDPNDGKFQIYFSTESLQYILPAVLICKFYSTSKCLKHMQIWLHVFVNVLYSPRHFSQEITEYKVNGSRITYFFQ